MSIDRRTLLAAGLAATAAPAFAQATAPASTRFPVWPGRPPGEPAGGVQDKVIKRSPDGPADDIAWPSVGTPMLTMVPATNPTGASVLICPGGGYTRIAIGRTGSGIARMFAARGITAFDLLYRLPHDGWAAGPDAPLQDAQRAIRIIRSRAAEWNLDPDRIAVTGFSAGGHLAARTASRADLATYSPIDRIDTASARPSVAGLFFPVIDIAGPLAHGSSKRELLGTDQSPERTKRFSAQDALPADMPPTFVAHAADDPTVKAGNSILMFQALQEAKIASELHIFEKGGHGLPMRQPEGGPHPWPDLFLAFANRHGFAA